MGNVYSFRKIIFGLRNEYIEVYKQLRELERYVDISSKVESYNFHIAGNPCKLFLYLHKKKNLLEKIEILLNLYVHGLTNYNVTDGVCDKYYYNKRVICSISEQDELNKLIEQIVQTDFFRNIVANNYVSIPCVENQFNTLHITPGCIRLINGINGEYPHLYYYPCIDELVMRNEDSIIRPDDIYKLLNLTLDGKYLNDYHHRILDKYEDKEIDIEDSFDSKDVRLEIIEESKKLILKPKRNQY